MKAIILLLLIFGATAHGEDIHWQSWSRATFDLAESSDRMIFLDVGMEGCTACRNMDEITYADPAVIEMLNRHFVPISVDSEARPDIGERYSDWAWPALIFMAPDATQVLAIRGNRLPRNFIPILQELLDKHADDALVADELAPYAAQPAPVATTLSTIRDRVRRQLDRVLNEQRGGWSRRGISSTSGARTQHLFFRAHLYDNADLRSLALRTADGYLQMLDHVWGGVYGSYFFASGGFIPEKRISRQANALRVFAEAYQVTRDVRYRNGLRKVDEYLQNWMASKQGTYFTSQEDTPPGLTERFSVRDYWNFEQAHQRRQFGIPPIDHAVYTDKNGEVIAAYVRAFEATGEINYLRVAERAARNLMSERLTPDGWMLQSVTNEGVVSDNRMREHYTGAKPFLGAQAWFGTGLLALYRATGNPLWFEEAHGLVDVMIELLVDAANGGFYSSQADDTARHVPLRKPLEQNAVAAKLLYDLSVYSQDSRYESLASRAIQAVAHPGIVGREGKVTGELALALEQLVAAYVEFTIVGAADDAAAQALFDGVVATYHPRKLAHFEAPGRYPDRGRPALYICNPDFCTVPIEDPRDIARHLEPLRGPAVSHGAGH